MCVQTPAMSLLSQCNYMLDFVNHINIQILRWSGVVLTFSKINNDKNDQIDFGNAKIIVKYVPMVYNDIQV